MADFLLSVLHPDGQIALLSDSSLEMGNHPKKVLEYVQNVTGYNAEFKNNFKESGHYIYKNDDIYFILDAGDFASPVMSGHAHADVFNYELSVKENRIIVDSGVGTYTKSAQRDFIRSTRAHNTVCIDKKSQAELWDSFRVGRMFNPKNVQFNLTNNGFSFCGTFDGYSKMIGDGIIHKREIKFENHVFEVYDNIDGKNIHLAESLIHLHPDAERS